MIEIARELASRAPPDWRVLVVGGWVRDYVLGLPSKDLDLEVYMAEPRQLKQWLGEFGEVKEVGESFGVFKLTIGGTEIDVSIPRRETKTGIGHKGFKVEGDPWMSPKEASLRRDFTMNSMIYDPLIGKVIDLHNGVSDLRNKYLRATSSHFAEDPLRVLRGMQFCGRFELAEDHPTREMCQHLAKEYHALPLDRIRIEWEKWALKSTLPSYGLRFLKAVDWLQFYPPLADLVGCKQSPFHHSEGDAFEHTCLAVDRMADICNRENVQGEDRLVLIYAALLHDTGKPACFRLDAGGQITTRGHAKEHRVEEFFESIGVMGPVPEKSAKLTREHMVGGKLSKTAVRRLATRLSPATIEEWAKVVESDSLGRGKKKEIPDYIPRVLRIAAGLRIEKGKPKEILMGRHLIARGHKPSKEFGVILREAYEAQLDGTIIDLATGMEWLDQKGW